MFVLCSQAKTLMDFSVSKIWTPVSYSTIRDFTNWEINNTMSYVSNKTHKKLAWSYQFVTTKCICILNIELYLFYLISTLAYILLVQ